MVNALFTSLALFGASVSAVGSGHIVNSCAYDVYLQEVPADGGGYQKVEKTLKPGDEWDQVWTSLNNGAGWSHKLSKEPNSFGHDILQYEYTFQDDSTIWYDLSAVDGNPWDRNWEIHSSSDDCNPKQQWYRHATDDAFGMQSCPSDASITVTLCAGETDDSPASYSSAPSSSAVAPTYANKAVASPTTFSTVKTTAKPSVVEGNVVTVTELVTDVATATVYAQKRHQHHERAAHQRA